MLLGILLPPAGKAHLQLKTVRKNSQNMQPNKQLNSFDGDFNILLGQ